MKYKRLMRMALIFCLLGGCSSPAPAASETPADPAAVSEEDSGRVLIVYFSRAGENWEVGNVAKGNTQIAVEIIAGETGYDTFRIRTVREYPLSYQEMLDVAAEEQKNNERPELREEIENFDDYGTILLGYPIWWADMPMAVYTFLESYDFTGKTVYPFNTHAGSGEAGTVSKIREVIPDADVHDGLAITGKDTQNDPDKVRGILQGWLRENGLTAGE
ncbi:MAG: NAD(P)H-dependent oxidoreductase [Solobacterium sp.]|nr:NAD(P)H-dependent oxidoreductase [Solobacterium sp.]